MHAGALGQGGRADRPVAADQVQAFEIGVPQIEMHTDLVVQQRQLDAQIAQPFPDPVVQPPAPPRRRRGRRGPGECGIHTQTILASIARGESKLPHGRDPTAGRPSLFGSLTCGQAEGDYGAHHLTTP
ncbi:hypothetical protein SBRY_20206 [Actinacidiphila bryophytorum]|uniref:Uncharacterized protein n=1 Tax=Actinacidiphila bryophytorum TaxID=1436133 RepID=A0A9W4GYX4_9ACTN|nr:hypothetical protein SBRY_20206 [Actinacidiphila bryophytorum]